VKNKIIVSPDAENDLGNTIEDKEKEAMDDSIEDATDVAIFSVDNRSALATSNQWNKFTNFKFIIMTTLVAIIMLLIVLTVLEVVIVFLTLSMSTRVREMIDGN
jgi:hypothetical protein